VYRPQFPNQLLVTDKVFRINLPLATGVQYPGYMEERVPHAVNQLYVGDLGTEEILVCVCDDGDVLVYTTRSIDQAITKCDSSPDDIEAMFDPPMAFFVANVGASCWGVAIHKAARMIAVSANTHIITVFAFALDRPNQRSEDFNSDKESGHKKRKWIDRSHDITIELNRHATNIPSISFCNAAEDLEGRFLVSTDIAGAIIIWDVWRNQRIYQYGPEYIWERHGISGQPPTLVQYFSEVFLIAKTWAGWDGAYYV
jgi:hypothetical protein